MFRRLVSSNRYFVRERGKPCSFWIFLLTSVKRFSPDPSLGTTFKNRCLENGFYHFYGFSILGPYLFKINTKILVQKVKPDFFSFWKCCQFFLRIWQCCQKTSRKISETIFKDRPKIKNKI
uniref:(northern house mosquito) hypothetical protein n=1 Tax=Culex pipiens TaxID=7175 RepID=A0A8D8C2P9_CULPI